MTWSSPPSPRGPGCTTSCSAGSRRTSTADGPFAGAASLPFMEPITGLAYGRIVIGALSLLSPSLTARLFLLDPKSNPQLGYMGRMFGSREIALGAITLASSGDARRRLIQLGVAVDGADAYTGIASAATG